MILVDAEGISVSRPKGDLFRDVSVTITAGDRVGIVGLNGAGKSTLLRVLTGQDEPDSGVVRRPKGTSIAILDQQPDLPPGPARAALGDSWEADAVLDRVGMGQRADADVSTMSGGEIRRVALARTLVTPADLLVLDEPTNHLDIDAIDWLEERLAAHTGGLLIVTHDRHLLDRVTSRILEVDDGNVYQHDGGYGSYLKGRADRESAALEADAVRRNLARREQAWLQRGAPARTRKSKAHIKRAEAVINQKLETSIRSEPMPLHDETPRLGDKVIEVDDLAAHVPTDSGDTRVLFDRLSLKLSNRERLGIVGPNGAGKSTLLDILALRRDPDAGTVTHGTTVKLAYFDQTGRELDPTQRVREALTGGEREPDWRDAALLERFWFDKETQWAPIGRLSGGERRRFQLVLTLRSQPNVLLLDEPTNDLDLDTLRSLEDFLEEWPGALVVVSHDRAFLERTVDEIVVVEDGKARRYAGGVEAWVEARRAGRRRGHASQSADTGASSGGGGKAAPRAPKGKPASGRSVSTIRHDMKQAEKSMARLEKRQGVLTTELEATTDHAKLTELGAELTTIQTELNDLEENWLALGEELEDR